MDLQKRVAGILTNPNAEWPVIAAEPDGVAALYRQYIAILAAIGPVCFVVRVLVGGAGTAVLSAAIASAAVQYAMTLVSVFVAALVIGRLAPRFGSGGSTAQTLKLVAYASTPVWIAGVFHLIIAIVPLTIVAILYAAYLFYLGLRPLLHTPHEQVVPLAVVSALVLLVISIAMRFVVSFTVPFYGF